MGLKIFCGKSIPAGEKALSWDYTGDVWGNNQENNELRQRKGEGTVGDTVRNVIIDPYE